MRCQRSEVEAGRETVETVARTLAIQSTSLKRGVNERFTPTAQRLLEDRELSTSLPRRLRGFTLIELLVVIAIMAVLASLIIPITGAVTRAKLRSRTKAELRQIEAAIENYKTKKGYYPPDNPKNQFFLNQLYYELSGTTLNSSIYTTLDSNGTLDPAQANPFMYGQGFQSIVNTTKGAGDEGMAAQKFIRELKPTQVATLGPPNTPGIKILVGSVGWDANVGPIPVAPGGPARVAKLNPFRYVSTNPTNNPKSFDLWIDILVQGKTNRICNWSDDPIVVGSWFQ